MSSRALGASVATLGIAAGLFWGARSGTTQGLRDLRRSALAQPLVEE